MRPSGANSIATGESSPCAQVEIAKPGSCTTSCAATCPLSNMTTSAAPAVRRIILFPRFAAAVARIAGITVQAKRVRCNGPHAAADARLTSPHFDGSRQQRSADVLVVRLAVDLEDRVRIEAQPAANHVGINAAEI